MKSRAKTDKGERETFTRYRIKIEGLLPQSWKEWFEGLTIRYQDSATILEGLFKDQSHLHGVLNKIRDLNLILLSVEALDTIDKEK